VGTHRLSGFSSEPRVPLGARRPVALVEPLAVMTAALSEQLALSVVVPMYNEQGNVAPLLERLAGILERLPGRPGYEIVVVNDGSTDATANAIRDEMRRHRHVVLVNLSRNFGHQLAATAGIELAGGDAVVLMDGDLQDPPELIGAFVDKWREGYDVVYAIRRTRKGESRFKLITAGFFYRVIRRLTKVSIPVDTGDFRLMSRRVVEALRRSPERHRFLRGMVSWVGFRQVGVEYDRDERLSGATKYPLPQMIRFAIDGITSFSDIPLRFASYFGFAVSALAFIYALIVVVAKLFRVYPPGYTPGWASTIVAVAFLGGVQLISLGIIGEYLGRIYDEVKGRPLYLIDDIERS
jgi:glycosyltransferase involved in cell wall biosynthesis